MATPGATANQQRFGANVRRRRRELALTIEDTAHAAGIHSTHLSRLERGEKEAKLNTIVALARALSTLPADLFRGVK